MKNTIFIFLLIIPLFIKAQEDTIKITATLSPLSHTLSVREKIVFFNNTGKELKNIYLHSSANAYSNSQTVLGKRKLEDRNKSLYFSQFSERGRITDFTIFINERQPRYLLRDFEFYEINLNKPLKPDSLIVMELNYNLKIPFDKVTGYGYFDDGYLLKNFFVQPLAFKDGKPVLEPFTDTEFNPYRKTFYNITMYFPSNFYLESDINLLSNNHLQGSFQDAVSISLSKTRPNVFSYVIDNQSVEVVIGCEIDGLTREVYNQNIKRELEFLKEKLGKLPAKIFLNSKTRKLENFIGMDDLNIGLKKVKIFPDSTKIDLKIFQQLAYSVVNQLINVNKYENHWIENGLLAYYQLQYLQKYYSDVRLIGTLPDDIKLLGIRPLKFFFFSELPLADRYKLGYRYIATQNFDQPINENYLELSNMNQIVVSEFKAGLSFNFLSIYLGKEAFEETIRNLIQEKKGREITASDLQNSMEQNFNQNFDWFFENYIQNKDRVNFKIKKFSSKKDDSLEINILNKTNLPAPILISGQKRGEIVNEKWIFSNKKDSLYSFPKADYDHLTINRNYLFPEINDNDNTLKTKGLFKNRKQLQLKLYADVDNPDYAQLFFEPKIKWNDYDKFILGLRFYNSSPFSKNLTFSASPTYSTGTKSLTGNAYVGYNYDMTRGIFRRIFIATGYEYYHYNTHLAYEKYSGTLSFALKKRPRSEVNRTIGLTFNSVEREIDSTKPISPDDYPHYNLLNVFYTYSNMKAIDEWYGQSNFQHSNIFNKASAELYYRREYLPGKKITFRFFGGYFFNNDSHSTFFDFGVSHITDYSFSYNNYLGRSAKSGLFYQQYLMAEGGFKSMINSSANQWITSLNSEIHLWKFFDLYADAGVYKSIGQSPDFIYDTGIKLRIIPDFLELYLPLQSSLGFEPGKDNYFSNVRFVFNLNIPAIINTVRRGWY
ncbi:MAG: hypothetical protein LBT29_04925 [Flavobacteriaceae bacterium]|jgi:hypothetical protein|nr:hypothetical protein [Flavobacteriaceae bacterium]